MTLSEELSKAFGRLVSELRQAKGYSMEDLAARSDLHRTHIGLVERGERSLTLASAAQIAAALDAPLSELLATTEKREQAEANRRIVDSSNIDNESSLLELTGLPLDSIVKSIEKTYVTLDVIDQELVANNSPRMAELVELANLSSMIGNLLSGALALESNGTYLRNRPHAYPDLVPNSAGLPDLEVKTALEKNLPKGHLPKAGVYLTFRYVLADSSGGYSRGKENRGTTPWIWEVRVGELADEDFSISNTPGDSGKTAVIRTTSFRAMPRLLYIPELLPYGSPSGPYGKA